MLLAEHIFLHDPTLQFVLALAGLIIACVILVMSRFRDLGGWGLGVVALALVAEWWPT